MKTPIYESPLLRVLSQAGMILILAATLGMLVNQVRPGNLPLWVKKGSVKQVPGVETPPLITLEEAEARYLRHSALFLDARSPEVYRQAHIMGARNLPWNLWLAGELPIESGAPAHSINPLPAGPHASIPSSQDNTD
jgi:hypothetical protein